MDRFEAVTRIIEQYIISTRKISELFVVAPDKCFISDGVGCCRYPRHYIEHDIVGPAYDRIIALREERRREHNLPPVSGNICPYHSDKGCILGELKSPLCISHCCQGRLSLCEYDSGIIRLDLIAILDGFQNGTYFDPEQNQWRVERIFWRVDYYIYRLNQLNSSF